MSRPKPLLYSQYYHVYNRGNNGEILFLEERNYHYFLKLYAKYLEPVVETYSYCLMPNHFHMLVRVLDPPDECQSSEDLHSLQASRAFSNLFSTYTKAINKAYSRTGSLFEKPFKRIWVDSDDYFATLVVYIHRNPQNHGFVVDFRDWPYSSYRAVLTSALTRVRRSDVIEWFGNQQDFVSAHDVDHDHSALELLDLDS